MQGCLSGIFEKALAHEITYIKQIDLQVSVLQVNDICWFYNYFRYKGLFLFQHLQKINCPASNHFHMMTGSHFRIYFSNMRWSIVQHLKDLVDKKLSTWYPIPTMMMSGTSWS